MLQFPVLGKGELDPEQLSLWARATQGPRAFFSTGAGEIKRLPDLYNAWLQFPELGQAMLRLSDAIRARGQLPGKLRELVILTTSMLMHARHEYDFHSNSARFEGLAEEVITAIGDGRRPQFRDEQERIIFDSNVELVRTGAVNETLKGEVVAAFGLSGLMQLVGLIGLYVIVSHTVNVANVAMAPEIFIDRAKLEEYWRSAKSAAAGEETNGTE